MNKLKPYYAYVGATIFMLTLGVIVFFDAILSTVRRNPQPEINYIIFLLIIAGAVMMMAHVFRINREGQLVQDFFNAFKSDADPADVQHILSNTRADVMPVLGMLQGLKGKPITAVQHEALEHELKSFEVKQSRRLLLAQYMGGMMVGMGLVGTFIGLLGALSEVGNLIGAFGGAVNNNDPVTMIQALVERLTVPMQAMGVAFSSSLFGVLGSLSMGILMVSIKGCASELNTMLRSGASLAVDLSSNGEAGFDLDPLQDALNDLAEQTPALKLMSAALEQSERRVRELVSSLGGLTASLTHYDQTLGTLAHALASRTDMDQRLQEGALRQQEGIERLTTQMSVSLQGQGHVAQLLQAQTTQQDNFLQKTQGLIAASSQSIAAQAQEQMQHLVESLRIQLSAQYAAMSESNIRAADAGQTAEKILQQHQAAMQQVQTWLEKTSSNSQIESTIRTQSAQRLEAIVGEYHSRQEQMLRQWLDAAKR